MRNHILTTIWIPKLIFTVCLSFFFVQLIVRDYVRLKKESISPYSSYFVLDRRKVDAKARMVTLNNVIPESFDYLLAFADKKEKFSKNRFEEYLEYYKVVVKYMPQRADAWGMVGYCYYQLNKPSEAVRALGKAAALNPKFFGFHYNLGVIYFKAQQYPKAAKSLQKAVALNPQEAANYIASSREIYLPLLMEKTGGGSVDSKDSEVLAEYFKTSYRHGYLLLIKSYLQQRDFGQVLISANQAIQFFGDQAIFHYYQGMSLYHLKRYQESSFFLNQSIKMDSQFPDAYYYLGLALKAEGQDEIAARVLQKGEMLSQAHQPAPENEIDLRIF